MYLRCHLLPLLLYSLFSFSFPQDPIKNATILTCCVLIAIRLSTMSLATGVATGEKLFKTAYSQTLTWHFLFILALWFEINVIVFTPTLSEQLLLSKRVFIQSINAREELKISSTSLDTYLSFGLLRSIFADSRFIDIHNNILGLSWSIWICLCFI